MAIVTVPCERILSLGYSGAFFKAYLNISLKKLKNFFKICLTSRSH